MIERLSLRRAAALLAVFVVMALPAVAFAHPQGHGEQTAVPPPIEQQAPPSDDGGAGLLLIVGIVIGVIALAGGLYAVKGLQKRPPQPAAKRPIPSADPKPATAPITDHRGVSPEAGA